MLTIGCLETRIKPSGKAASKPNSSDSASSFMEYEYQSDVRDLCSVCSLAYSQACKVRKCPLILVEVMN